MGVVPKPNGIYIFRMFRWGGQNV